MRCWFPLGAWQRRLQVLQYIRFAQSMLAQSPCGRREGAMAFSGVNYLAIVIAAAVAWFTGAGWYMALAKPWMAALGITPEQMEAAKRQPGAYLPFVYCF